MSGAMTRTGGTIDPASLAGRVHEASRGRHLLVLLDFDGTLCEFASDPEVVTLSAAAAAALQALAACRAVTLGFVSGRRAADLRRRLPQDLGAYVAGAHGLEIDAPGGGFVHPGAGRGRTAARRIAATIGPELARWPGTFLEDKGFSLALHVRDAEPDAATAAAIRFRQAAADALADGALRILEGACVTELLPAVDWHKGRAVEWIRRRVEDAAGPTFTIFAGDDRTDEDAFRVVAGDGLSIATSERVAGAAARLDGPREVAAFLAALARRCGGEAG